MPHDSKLVELLLNKAKQDEKVLQILMADPEAPYEAIGFHAQQAAEKLIKAVLAFNNIAYRRVHDILELVDLLNDNGVVFPVELEEVRRLSPFAVDYRYDVFFPEANATFARETIQLLISQIREWSEGQIKES